MAEKFVTLPTRKTMIQINLIPVLGGCVLFWHDRELHFINPSNIGDKTIGDESSKYSVHS
jgi:hypothetical protein